MAVMFITHDMGVVAEIADQVIVMRHGKIVETGDVDTIFHAPQHDYTRMPIGSVTARAHGPTSGPAPADPGRRGADPAGARPVHGVPERQADHARRGQGVATLMPGESLGIVANPGRQDHHGPRLLRVLHEPAGGAIEYRRGDGSVVDLMQADAATLRTAGARCA